ncbi:MAG: hypothetical protein RIE31_03740 [Alphaproteobacteria bacterium]
MSSPRDARGSGRHSNPYGRQIKGPACKAADLASLRQSIARLEQRHSAFESHDSEENAVRRGGFDHPAWRFGLTAMDCVLPAAGLSPGGLHELSAAHQDGPASHGFALALLRRLAEAPAASRADSAPILWCQDHFTHDAFGPLHGHGVANFGLDPGRFILLRSRRTRDALWAMEESILSGAVAAVVGEVRAMDFTASRRLALACRRMAVPCLIHRRDGDPMPGAGQTRWRVAAAPSRPDPWDARAPGGPAWRITLERCHGGRQEERTPWPTTWNVEFDGETGCFSLAASMDNRKTASERRPTHPSCAPDNRRRQAG